MHNITATRFIQSQKESKHTTSLFTSKTPTTRINNNVVPTCQPCPNIGYKLQPANQNQ
eukprot:gene3135-2117_t